MAGDADARTRTVAITNQRGLHARAAAKFVTLAGQFEAEVWVAKDGQEVSGLSIMGLMMLAAAPGAAITIRTRGRQADAALTALCRLVEERFGES